MLTFVNGGHLIQSASELPELPDSVQHLFLDFETTSRDDDLDALSPWRHCHAAGFAVTWDDHTGAYYIPVGHRSLSWNVNKQRALDWLRELIRRSKYWTNHNVKYDAHVLYNDCGIDSLAYLEAHVCTVVQTKILDSDRQFRGGYGLDALSASLLHEDISGYEAELKGCLGKSKDYGVVPADIMGKYACQDVLTNRRLKRYLDANLPAESSPVIETEIALTSELIRMERRGLLVKPIEVSIAKLHTLKQLVELEMSLHKEVGYMFSPGSNPDCYDVLCNHYGLPVLAWTQKDDGSQGGPSFDKDTLAKYAARIDAPQKVVEDLLTYRSLSTFKSLFLETFERLAITVDHEYAVLHPDHNQCVRTGRMSVKTPNTQQQDGRSKRLFKPGRGMAYMSCDASQIEFRTIAHYTQDKAIIDAYIANPDVDFHQRVAEMCGVKRRPAKTVNFSVAFGQGRGATVELLSTDKDIVSSIADAINELVRLGDLQPEGRERAFRAMARQRGEAVYDKYHATFPDIRRVARDAAHAAERRGFVRNIRGRRRYLPPEHAHKAFNTLNQSSAADIIKERMVALASELRGTPIEIVTQVHDEVLMVGPEEIMHDRRTQRDIVAILEDVKILRVPIRFNFGVSSDNWMMASKSVADGGCGGLSIPLEEIKQASRLIHLK